MIADVGVYSLTLAVLAAAAGALACVAAARFDNPRLLGTARTALGVIALLLTFASAALMTALLQDAFAFEYVAGYSEKAQPLGYKIAAFWAGQEGSLLLWAWMLAIMSFIAAMIHRQGSVRGQAAMLATLLLITGFFALLMVFAADPFKVQLTNIPLDGRGLNPLLQDPGMIAHPPLLFLGYAGFTIPFAMMIGAMFAHRRMREDVILLDEHHRLASNHPCISCQYNLHGLDPRHACPECGTPIGQSVNNRNVPMSNTWIAATRRWTLIAWLALSIGILLGAQWAYVELGWGGYWAWDPVENASLLPWLTGTAVLHSLTVQVRRGMFKRWNVILIAATFILCIFGTYLTRSGVISSVHGFEPSLVGTFFLVFMGLVVAGTAAIIAWRYTALAPERELEVLVSREGAFLAGNILLAIITATTLMGTIFPLISKLFGKQVTVTAPFYNKVVIPMSLILLGLMAMGPVLKSGRDAAEKMGRVIIAPSIAGAIAAVIAGVAGFHSPFALGCAFVTVAALYSLIADFAAAVLTRRKNTGENILLAALRLFDYDHRRYGGQLTHIGMIVLAIGVTGSSLYGVTQTFQLTPGQSQSIGRYTLTFVSLREVEKENYTAVEAVLTMTAPGGVKKTLYPQRRFYNKHQDMPNTEVALESNWREDIYLTIAGWDTNGKAAAIQAIVNPLVSWIWTGGIILTFGAVICILPRLLPQSRREEAVDGTAGSVRAAA